MEQWTIRRILKWTAKDLASRSVPSPRLDAEVLVAHVLGIDRLGLYLDLDRPLDELERASLRELIRRRRDREPVAYLTGTKEFWSLSLAVSGRVLVPRPDTEILVEEALELLPEEGARLRAVDVGTGTGCVALALATERPGLQVLGTDASRRAATLAAQNAHTHDLGERASFLAGNLLEPVGGPVDLVVSNLPYIPSAEIDDLEPEVSRWEPRAALDGGADGLDLFRPLIEAASRILCPAGKLALEVGHDRQAAQVVELFDDSWKLLRVRRDYSGVERVVVAQRS